MLSGSQVEITATDKNKKVHTVNMSADGVKGASLLNRTTMDPVFYSGASIVERKLGNRAVLIEYYMTKKGNVALRFYIDSAGFTVCPQNSKKFLNALDKNIVLNPKRSPSNSALLAMKVVTIPDGTKEKSPCVRSAIGAAIEAHADGIMELKKTMDVKKETFEGFAQPRKNTESENYTQTMITVLVICLILYLICKSKKDKEVN